MPFLWWWSNLLSIFVSIVEYRSRYIPIPADDQHNQAGVQNCKVCSFEESPYNIIVISKYIRIISWTLYIVMDYNIQYIPI